MFNGLSTGEKVAAIILAVILIAIVVAIEGWIIAALWNWLMPTIFGLTTITVWQGVGISLLCDMLFKSHNIKTKES